MQLSRFLVSPVLLVLASACSEETAPTPIRLDDNSAPGTPIKVEPAPTPVDRVVFGEPCTSGNDCESGECLEGICRSLPGGSCTTKTCDYCLENEEDRTDTFCDISCSRNAFNCANGSRCWSYPWEDRGECRRDCSEDCGDCIEVDGDSYCQLNLTLAPTLCSADGDCPPSAHCEDGRCVTTPLPNLATCSEDGECESGTCCPGAGDEPSVCDDTCGEWVCTGSTVACDERVSKLGCEVGEGCAWGYLGECQGPTFDCTKFAACPVGFCSWNSQNGRCTGTTSCAAHDHSTQCDYDYLGGQCTWVEEGCKGIARACESLPLAECSGTPGCTLSRL